MKTILFILLLLFITPVAKSQHWEFGALIGGSNYSGDLAHGSIGIAFNETHFAGGAIIRYNFNGNVSLKGNVFYGKISGTDENASSEEFRMRNLHFESTLLDIGLQGEYYLTGYNRVRQMYSFAPYVMGGFSVFRFNPRAEYEGEWYELQPLGTEGQGTTQYQDRKAYALTQISIPLGIGVKHSISKNFTIGFEFGPRITFTDYLDDVSTTYVDEFTLTSENTAMSYNLSNRTGEYTGESVEHEPGTPRGNSTRNDHYFFAGLTITYVFFPAPCFRF